jgi:hypothetical protein
MEPEGSLPCSKEPATCPYQLQADTRENVKIKTIKADTFLSYF